MKKCSMKNLFIVILILLLSVACTKHEYYYSTHGRCVTVIKKFGANNSWFVIPYKYESKEIPKCNYIEIKENTRLYMYWVSDSVIYVLNEAYNTYHKNVINKIRFSYRYKIYDINKNIKYYYNIAYIKIDTNIYDQDTVIYINEDSLKKGVDDAYVNLGIYIH
jgi:hypothetical protein